MEVVREAPGAVKVEVVIPKVVVMQHREAPQERERSREGCNRKSLYALTPP